MIRRLPLISVCLLTAVLATTADEGSAEASAAGAASDALRLEHHQYLRTVRPPRDTVKVAMLLE